jgi:alkylation response protein AidB-like acyl-CoA dehydrogenase
LLPDIASGRAFATVGISHLTTSRRHLDKPVLAARLARDGFVLNGYSPWVTGGVRAATIVTGATLEDGRQILFALSTEAPGVSVAPPARLVGLSASHTGEVRLDEVHVSREQLLAGPIENVMTAGIGARTGG